MAKVRAIIKHCRLEGGPVVYFKSGKRFFKMTTKKDIRLCAYRNLPNMIQLWKAESIIDVVYEDEQVLLNGEPIHITNTMMVANGWAEDFLKSASSEV